MHDIESRADIDVLMRVFYERALADDLIGPIFTDVAKLDLEHHLPIIGDFWETLLFNSGGYAKHGRNPLEIHKQLHLRSHLERRHFERWLEIFVDSVDRTFGGERAEFLKLRANAISERMQAYIYARSDAAVSPPDTVGVVRSHQ